VRTALLLSGGMDSISIAYWRKPEAAITIDYGQRPAMAEVRAASAVTEALGIEHHVIRANLSALGSGDMAGADALRMAPVSEWWPFRNQMLITLGAMKAVAIDVERLLIGSLRTDSLHADGSQSFVSAIDTLLRLQEGSLVIEAPAIKLSAVELVRVSSAPMEILGWAHSCHVSDYACGLCRGCRKHYETLVELGADPY
jgi:7-cyano-7-deazaguanine synthase